MGSHLSKEERIAQAVEKIKSGETKLSLLCSYAFLTFSHITALIKLSGLGTKELKPLEKL